MTVESSVQDVTYDTDGVTLNYTVPFYFLDGAHVYADFISASESITSLTNGTDFTVSGAGDEDGGTLTLAIAKASGYKLHIYRLVPVTQETGYQQNSAFPAKTTETALDKLTMILQQHSSGIDNSVRYPLEEYGTDGTLPRASERALTVLAFDELGGQTLLPISASVGAGDLRDEIGGDGEIGFVAGLDFEPGTTKQFTLSRAPGSRSNLFIEFDNGYQGGNQIDSLADRVLTFKDPVPEGVQRVFIRTGTTISLYTPADESVTEAKLADHSVTDAKLATTGKLANRLSHYIDLTDPVYGADPTGVRDSTSAIQSALDTGGRITGPVGGKFKISSTLFIGNGSSLAPSTVNGVVLEGVASGASASEVTTAGAPFEFVWAGASGGTMMKIRGPIYGIHLSGITFDCAGVAAKAIDFFHAFNSRFDDILAINYRGSAFSVDAYLLPTGCVIGSSGNVFTNVHAKKPGSGGSGMVVGGDVAVSGQLDVARNTFMNCDWWRDGSDALTYGLAYQFADNNTFIECHTYGQGGTQGLGLYVNPPSGDTTFPKESVFLNCALEGGVNNSTSWTTTRGIGFFPYPTGDSEPIPVGQTLGQFYGYTDTAEQIGGVVVAPGGTRITQHTSTVASLTFGAIDGQSSSEKTVSVANAAAGDTVVVASTIAPQPPGCSLTGYVNGAGSVAVRWINSSESAQTPGTGSYRIDLWKH